METKTRAAEIIAIMENENVISIQELAKRLNCTEMTVRRNLDRLQESGFVERKRGYAVLTKQGQVSDYRSGLKDNIQEKQAMAAVALRFVADGQNIALDSGSTVEQLVRILPKDIHLFVITSSLSSMNEFITRENIQVLLPQGFLHHSNVDILISNPHSLDIYHPDIAFMTCRTFQPSAGAFEHTADMMLTKQALSHQAGKIILMADASKWNRHSFFNSIGIDEISTIITDTRAPAEDCRALAAAGHEVFAADVKSKTYVHYTEDHEETQPL